jgi:hypothetical protein
MTSEPMTLEDLKKEARAFGYTKIQRTLENSRVEHVIDWRGFSTHVEGGMYATVTYYLEGNKSDGHKVRVHKALEEGDHWYILS